MATNKRKEAAALFELIDKSTLKVPKNAGSLKIPSWWSSKSNPPGNGNMATITRPPAALTSSTTSAAKSAALAPPVMPQAKAPAPEQPDAPIPAVPPAPDSQHRLFDPAQTNADGFPASTPSIRPPAPTIAPPPPAPSIAAPARTAQPQNNRTPVAPSRPSQPRVFAPATRAIRADGMLPPTNGIPSWVLIGGAAVLIVLIVCGIMIYHNSHKAVAAPPPHIVGINDGSHNTVVATGPAGGGQGTRGLIPNTPNTTGRNTGVPSATGMAIAPNNSGGLTSPTPPGGGGRVYADGTVQRSSDRYYIWIATTPSRDVAERNAKFIADHGVDVSIEFTRSQLYVIVSVKSYVSSADARTDLKTIVDIGHLTDDYKKGKKAWDDAYPAKPPAPKPAA